MSNLTDVIAPMNQEGTKATVLRWGKKIGDVIRKDEPLLELETDKVTVEIPAPESGELVEILAGPDIEVSAGQVLARVRLSSPEPIVVSDAAVKSIPPSGASTDSSQNLNGISGSSPPLSPAVRRLLLQHDISAKDVAGSGRRGRLTAQDIVRHVSAAHVELSAPSAPALTPTSAAVPAPERPQALSVRPEAGGSRIPHTSIRRRIAEHMQKSLAQAPHVTTVFETDLTRVQAHRAKHATDFERRGARLTLTVYFIAACARALRAHPQVNATFHEDALELHADANIGIGTALGNDGLIVPVLHRTQELNLFGIAQRLGQLVAAARAGKLAAADVRGGTFTISNHGVGGSLLAAPIVINQPQVAILGVGKVERRVCVLPVDGTEVIAIRSMCYLTLTLDHRAIDAFQSNAFLSSVVDTLEGWPID